MAERKGKILKSITVGELPEGLSLYELGGFRPVAEGEGPEIRFDLASAAYLDACERRN